MPAAAALAPLQKIEMPAKFGFLLEMHPYKVAYGGRYGLKTRSFVRALLALGAKDVLRILCCREVMNSLKDSVHQEIKDQIVELGLEGFYRVSAKGIRGANGTEFIYAGLSTQTTTSLKSMPNIDICWIEEAQTVEKASWDILLPTIRATGSEIWVSFNPDMDSDDTWVRWIEQPLPGTVVVKSGWQDAQAHGWFPEKENQKRLHFQRTQPDDYENIWEGAPRTVVAGAIYTRELLSMVTEQRTGRFPYDPRFPVHCIWDLGWNDAMVVIMVQKTTPSTLNIINYREVSGWRYDQVIGDIERLGYRWGYDWMPHDADQHHPTSGSSGKKELIKLKRQVKLIPKTDPEARIRAARMMFPSVFIDTAEMKTDYGFLGGARLAYCLKRYKRNIPKTTGEPMSPTHDFASHAADAYGALAEIVHMIRGEFETPIPLIPGYTNVDPGMGTLG